jgi:hypothetical protein
MLIYILQRKTSNNVCTLGVIKDENNHPICVTLELPWLNNQPMVSCIPAGIYKCNRYMSPKRGYEVFELQGVPDRTAIEIHIGNYPADTDGCILLGTSYGQNSIVDSTDAFNKFMAGLNGVNSFYLRVIDV